MPEVSRMAMETTGNDWKRLGTANRERIEDALVGQKREALAHAVHVSPGQLSKLLNGELARFADLCAVLGLQVVPVDYVAAIERVLKERL